MKRLIFLIFCLNFLFGCQNKSSITQETQNISPEKSVEAEVKTPTPINTISPEKARCNRKADKVFYQTYPEREGKTIEKDEEEWANKWLEIRSSISGCEFLAEPKTNLKSSFVSTLESKEQSERESSSESSSSKEEILIPSAIRKNWRKKGFELILPKEIPDGFEISDLNYSSAKYSISYQGPNNSCFEISATIPSGSSAMSMSATLNVNDKLIDSTIFETVRLQRIEFSQSSDVTGLLAIMKHKKSGFYYDFSSISRDNCNSISIPQASSIIKSMTIIN